MLATSNILLFFIFTVCFVISLITTSPHIKLYRSSENDIMFVEYRQAMHYLIKGIITMETFILNNALQ